ncbi:MAG: DUF2520 domain-containing protein [Actinomycetota bacterium]
MEVAVVGAGRVGTALAVLLGRAGHRIVGVSGREATRARAAEHLPGIPVGTDAEVVAGADLVLIALPDDRVEATCESIAATGAFSREQIVAHCSGALGLDVLRAARARTMSLHPLQTFPDVGSALGSLPGAPIAVTAADEETAAVGEDLVRALGAVPVRVDEDRKALYHAAAVFASNYLVTITALAEDLFVRAGLEDALERFLPLSRATLDNVAQLGPAWALTGPAVRGDAGTVRRNLEALAAAAPDAVPAYVALARVALDLGARSGRLAPDERLGVEEVLEPWR